MRKARFLVAALCAAVLMCGFATPAYAGGDEETGGTDLWEGLDPATTAQPPYDGPEDYGDEAPWDDDGEPEE